MPTKLFQKGREVGNTFPYVCQALNPIHGQYHNICHFHWSADFTGPVQSLSLICVEITLLLVPALRELRDFFDICKKISPIAHALRKSWSCLKLGFYVRRAVKVTKKRLWLCLKMVVSETLGWFFCYICLEDQHPNCFMKMLKSTGNKREPCWTPLVTEEHFINEIFSSKMKSHCGCIFHGWDTSTQGVFTLCQSFLKNTVVW